MPVYRTNAAGHTLDALAANPDAARGAAHAHILAHPSWADPGFDEISVVSREDQNGPVDTVVFTTEDYSYMVVELQYRRNNPEIVTRHVRTSLGEMVMNTTTGAVFYCGRNVYSFGEAK